MKLPPLKLRRPTILFGGSFDPVHDGHLHVAREAMAAMPDAEQLLFVPAARSPGKQPPRARVAQRLEWLRLATEPLGFRVWDVELARGGVSYTVDTLEAAHALGARPESLYWLLGADAYQGFPRWKSPDRIRALCRLLVVSRPGHLVTPQSPTDRFLEIPFHPASSRVIRDALANDGSHAEWLPPAVRAAMDKLLPGQNPYVRNLG